MQNKDNIASVFVERPKRLVGNGNRPETALLSRTIASGGAAKEKYSFSTSPTETPFMLCSMYSLIAARFEGPG